MSGNTIGSIFRVTTFGESHGEGLGCVIDGCPSGISLGKEEIQKALNRRRPGVSIGGSSGAGEGSVAGDGGAAGSDGDTAENAGATAVKEKLNPSVTARKEADEVEILSGVFNGKTEGTTIALIIRKTSQHSADYGNLTNTMRPGHADYTYCEKYGMENRDYRGGGRASGRETAARVAAGAVAQAVLDKYGIKVTAYTIKAAGVEIPGRNLDQIEQNSLRAPDNEAAEKIQHIIEETRRNGDSAGGIVECVVTGCPAGLGEPVFDKLDSEIGKAVLSIGAVKGIEFGAGFEAADLLGSQNNDKCHSENGKIVFDSNNCGGILGGISNGNNIVFRAAVKPVPSIFKSQETVAKNENGLYENKDLEIKGRHDICLCPRIVPVIEAMTQIVLADMILRNNAK